MSRRVPTDAVSLASKSSVQSSGSRCRLCDCPAAVGFTLQVRGAFEAAYERCAGCGSLQVQDPHWIGEAYVGPLGAEDTGAAQRALYDQMVVSWLYPILSMRRSALLLDFGGGEGLLVRLLRDVGINAKLQDKYGDGAFAQAFVVHGDTRPEIVTSFEVWEHFVDPSTSIDGIFRLHPSYVFISTVLYKGQGPDWWYLAPLSGQHVFFYTFKAMELVARRFGYHAYTFKGAYTLFSRSPLASWRRRSLNLVLTHKIRNVLLAAMPFYAGRSLDRPELRGAGK